MTGPELIDAGFKVFGMGLGVWALKAYVAKATKTPNASTGFLDLHSLQEHCARVQTGCIEKLEAKIQAMAESVRVRLKTGDKILDDHEQRLRSIQNDLTKSIEKLETIQTNHAKEIAVEVLKLIRKAKGQK